MINSGLQISHFPAETQWVPSLFCRFDYPATFEMILFRTYFKLSQSKHIIFFHGLYIDAGVDGGTGIQATGHMLNNGAGVEQLYQILNVAPQPVFKAKIRKRRFLYKSV